MKLKRFILFSWFALSFLDSFSQHYQALHGSNYGGSIGVHNNPASIVNTPYQWDITLSGVQAQMATNVIRTANYSLLSPAAKSQYYFRKGEFVRKGSANANINLINTRISINRKKAFAFGANLRANANLQTSPYYYNDTLKNVGLFLGQNTGNQPMNLDFKQSGWVEIYGTYAQTIFDNDFARLNAGITLKLSRGISGLQGQLNNGRFRQNLGPGNSLNYLITDGQALVAYSSNYDRWSKSNGQAQNIRDFLTYTQGGASLDAGVELLIKTEAVPTVFDDDDYTDYQWKLGLSLLDAGANQYSYGLKSIQTYGLLPGITSTDLNLKFDSTITNLTRFNDSLSTIVTQFNTPGGQFRIINPARLVLNADYYLQGNFFINAELSINLSPLAKKRWLYVKDMNLITITPRWETRTWGFYMPVSLNNQSKFWIGGAVKAGPLLVGFHNLGYLFSKSSIQNGGGYIALILKAPNDTGKQRDKKLDCPPR